MKKLIKNIEINQLAFNECENLTEIHIFDANSLTIKEESFTCLSSLHKIFLNSNKYNIHRSSFASCSGIKMIQVNSPNDIPISSESLQKFTDLRHIDLNSGNILNLHHSCFKNNTKLDTIILQGKYFSYPDNFFQNHAYLKYISIGR